jgi:hypothetical protein
VEMEQPMKRKQFHLSSRDENILKELAKKKSTSEAEVVREAIREYAAKKVKSTNSLVKMAEKACEKSSEGPSDLSVNHDRYLLEIDENGE